MRWVALGGTGVRSTLRGGHTDFTREGMETLFTLFS